MSTSPLAPAVAAYPTRCGIWLIPDTPDGRDLIATVKEGPHTSWDDLPDFDPFLTQVILGTLAALTLWAAFATGVPPFGLIATLLAAGAIAVGVETRQVRADERRLRASGLAVPVPEQLWGRPMPTSDPARSRRHEVRRLEELQALPAVEGIPALTLVWLPPRRRPRRLRWTRSTPPPRRSPLARSVRRCAARSRRCAGSSTSE